MTDQKRESDARVTLKVTVPLMTQLLIDNPQAHAHLTEQIMAEAMRKISMRAVQENIEEGVKRSLNQFKNDVTCEIAENLGATVKRSYKRPHTWALSAELKQKIKAQAQIELKSAIREAVSDSAMKEVIHAEVKRATDYILSESLNDIIDRRIKRTLSSLGGE